MIPKKIINALGTSALVLIVWFSASYFLLQSAEAIALLPLIPIVEKAEGLPSRREGGGTR